MVWVFEDDVVLNFKFNIMISGDIICIWWVIFLYDYILFWCSWLDVVMNEFVIEVKVSGWVIFRKEY